MFISPFVFRRSTVIQRRPPPTRTPNRHLPGNLFGWEINFQDLGPGQRQGHPLSNLSTPRCSGGGGLSGELAATLIVLFFCQLATVLSDESFRLEVEVGPTTLPIHQPSWPSAKVAPGPFLMPRAPHDMPRGGGGVQQAGLFEPFPPSGGPKTVRTAGKAHHPD